MLLYAGARSVGRAFRHRLSGAYELRKRVRPDGAAPSLHRPSGVRELPQAGSPFPGGKFFAEPQRGRRRTHGGGQKGRTTCGFPSSLNSYLSLRGHGGNRRTATASKKGERQSGYCSVSFVKHLQFTDRLLLHIRATLRRVRHNSAARFVSALLRTVSAKINCTKRLIRRCRALQHAKELRDTVMSRLLEVADLCSRTVSDPANRLRKTRKKKSSAVPLFEAVTYRKSAPD